MLLLGRVPEQPAPDPEDNEILMPIGINVYTVETPENEYVLLPNVNPPTKDTGQEEPLKSGAILGVAIKLDTADIQNPKPVDNPKNEKDDNPAGKGVQKRTFITKVYGIRQRTKPVRKFKCSVCQAELDTVRDYN